MKRWLLVAALAGTASAQPSPPPPIRVPADWVADLALVNRASAAQRLPATGLPANVVAAGFWPAGGALRWEQPARGGAVLYVTRYDADVAADRRDAVASAELGELAAAMQRQGAGVVTEGAAQKADPGAKQLEATARWRDPGAGLVSSARLVVAASAKGIQVAKAECMLAADAPPAVARACEDALATLSSTIPPGERVALSIVAPAPATPDPAPPRSLGAEPARLDDGSRAIMPPMPVAATREPDRRPMYVGGGLVVLAVAFYLNRRRRERFESDEPAPAREDRVDRDDDSDDLHAAAREQEDDKS